MVLDILVEGEVHDRERISYVREHINICADAVRAGAKWYRQFIAGQRQNGEGRQKTVSREEKRPLAGLGAAIGGGLGIIAGLLLGKSIALGVVVGAALGLLIGTIIDGMDTNV